MLQHPESTSDVGATQARVSPQELVQAVASLEARRQAEAQAQRETLLLGEAIESLGIPDSADAVLAEVQAQRAQHATSRPRSRRPSRALPWLLATSLLGNVLLSGVLIRGFPHPPLRQAPPAVAAPVADAPVPELKPLADVGVGQAFHCDIHTVLDIARGKTDSIVDINPRADSLWTMERTPQGYVLKAWTTEAQALALLNGREGWVHNARDMDINGANPLSVPAERLRSAGPYGNSNENMTIPARPTKNTARKETH